MIIAWGADTPVYSGNITGFPSFPFVAVAVQSELRRFQVDNEVRQFVVDNDVRKFQIDNEVRSFDVD